jgi:3-dehydroquinate synthase
VERRTPLVAIGGGTLGDSAGFAAATYYRGIPLVHVPTTLLAQVDSSIGGKTAINHPLAKNAVGAFYQPAFVLADINTLMSLPARELLSGLAEVIKYGLIFDPAFARWLDRDWDKILKRKPEALLKVVSQSAQWKGRVVSQDELDMGGRREFLNFGHTLGHALESATNFAHFTHGEAVAWGMSAAITLSHRRGWLKQSDRRLADSLLEKLNRPLPPRGLRWGSVFSALLHDKKVRDGRSVFVLLHGLGHPVRVNDVSPSELARATASAGLKIMGKLP